jgi:RimJ/RimL family protein N-acetyltransferase
MRAAALHLGFAGLGANVAITGAWHDNAASLGVTRSLGYVPNGEEILLRRDKPDVMLHFRMARADWEARRRDDITIEGLEPCLGLFGTA